MAEPGAELTADEVAAALGLVAHPEGGAYAETWRGTRADGARGSGSAIVFMLRAGEVSAWHRVDATEIWHFHAGAPVELLIADDAASSTSPVARHVVGTALHRGQRPQVVVPAGAWQSARSLGAWSLVGCTVSPAFTFEGFELARPEIAAALDAAQEADGDGEPDGGPEEAGAPASSMR